jgi:general L-amino acid transport system substrate-binding protein
VLLNYKWLVISFAARSNTLLFIKCRAIAAAVMGNSSQIEIFNQTDSERFENLSSRSVDVLVRAETHTMDRDVFEAATGVGFSFSAPFLYSGLVFSGKPTFVECAEKLDTFFGECRNLKICVQQGTTHEKIVRVILPGSVMYPYGPGELQTLFSGTCNVIADEPISGGEARLLEAGYAEGDFTHGTTIFSREPLAMVTRDDDPVWSDLVNTVLQSLWAAEAQDITQDTAEAFKYTPIFGNLPESMFVDAIAAVGNFGELYARHLEKIVPRAGVNSLNVDGTTGMLYSFPFGDLEVDGPGPVQDGTLQAILDRGHLRCGLSSNITSFTEFDPDSEDWGGLDVSFCRVISAAVFDGEAYTVEFLSFSDEGLFVALASGEIDVLAGAMADLVTEVLEPTSMTGFAFSSPYFYGSTSNDGDLK